MTRSIILKGLSIQPQQPFLFPLRIHYMLRIQDSLWTPIIISLPFHKSDIFVSNIFHLVLAPPFNKLFFLYSYFRHTSSFDRFIFLALREKRQVVKTRRCLYTFVLIGNLNDNNLSHLEVFTIQKREYLLSALFTLIIIIVETLIFH